MKTLQKVLMILIALTATVLAQKLSGKEILKKMDANNEYKTMVFEAVMEIHSRGQVRTKKMIAETISDTDEGDKAITKFVNKEDAGTKYLKIGDRLWIYFPSENDVMKISGHLLKQGMMGSDVSYEDALEQNEKYKKYNIELHGDKEVNARDCYVVMLTAKEGAEDVSYYKREMFVDKENFVGIKENMYAKSGRLLKEFEVINPKENVKKIGPFYIAVKNVVRDKKKRGSKTIFHMTSIKLNVELDEGKFSKRYLRR